MLKIDLTTDAKQAVGGFVQRAGCRPPSPASETKTLTEGGVK